MLHLSSVIETFPSARIPDPNGGLPVEVSLIAQLGHGAGTHLFASIAARQSQHSAFIDELDEPSAKLAGTHFELGDVTSLYSFVVGPNGHPFHRHAGHRIFTAVSGSGGAQLRFSTASPEDIAVEPKAFIDALHFINIPPDCLFTVRFGGERWHQFSPLSKNTLNPVFFALSCHTNELGGDLPEGLKQKIKNNEADIPSLTEVLPPPVSALLQGKDFQDTLVSTTTLSLDAPPGTVHRKVCDTFRGRMGLLRGAWSEWRYAGGYVSKAVQKTAVLELENAPENSLLRLHLTDEKHHHDDTFMMTLEGFGLGTLTASEILEHVLEGFLLNAPAGVSRMMMVRNLLVKPLGLRTSPLGCPVSSLLSGNTQNLFAGQYPVFDQRIAADGSSAQVILGANDKHLIFRSCVGIEITGPDRVNISLGTRVHCKNLFGRFYMGAIDYVHRRYVTSAMLRRASDYLLLKVP